MQRAQISSQIAALRLPGLMPRDLAAPDGDAESPVDIRGLPPNTPLTPDTGVRTKLELPCVPSSSATGATTLSVSQNEIKKAQNRKSAKRFREAQKKRWQSLQEQVHSQQRTIDELRCALSTRGSKRSMSIDALIGNASELDNDPTKREEDASAEAEASLYAQLLSSAAPTSDGGAYTRPYVAELGILERCICISDKGVVVACRRGSPLQIGKNILDGVPEADAVAVRNALVCGSAVAVGYVRDGFRFNAVVKPVTNSTDLLVAEFTPFDENRL